MKLSAALRQPLSPWQARWERQAKRIDALSLRERVVLFLALAAVLAALFDTGVLAPLQGRAKQRAAALAAQSGELKTLRDSLLAATTSGATGPEAELRNQLAAAQAERQQLDAQLAKAPALSDSAATRSSLAAVLQQLLTQQPGLTLNRLALLEGPGARASEPMVPGLRWQGVDLQLEGSYGALTLYIQALEKQLPGLQWGDLRLTASGHETGGATRMQAQVYLLRKPS